jgi:hypothetical protein
MLQKKRFNNSRKSAKNKVRRQGQMANAREEPGTGIYGIFTQYIGTTFIAPPYIVATFCEQKRNIPVELHGNS